MKCGSLDRLAVSPISNVDYSLPELQPAVTFDLDKNGKTCMLSITTSPITTPTTDPPPLHTFIVNSAVCLPSQVNHPEH